MYCVMLCGEVTNLSTDWDLIVESLLNKFRN